MTRLILQSLKSLSLAKMERKTKQKEKTHNLKNTTDGKKIRQPLSTNTDLQPWGCETLALQKFLSLPLILYY